MISLLKSLIVGFFIADMLERKFPQQFRIILTEISFNVLYLYSKLQIYFFKMNKYINNFIESNPNLLKIKNELDALINSNTVIPVMTQYFKNGELLTTENDFDLAILSCLSDDKKCVNKKILYDKDENIIITECSNIKFLLIEIKVGEKCHKVDLKTDDYNYYLVGNKFKKQFFIYYLKYYLKIDENIKDNEIFTLKIIDHDVNTITIDFTDKNESILLEKNGYKLSITNHHDE